MQHQFGSFLSTPSLLAFFCIDLFLGQNVPPGRGKGDPFLGARSHQIGSLMGSGVFFPMWSGSEDVIQWVSVNFEKITYKVLESVSSMLTQNSGLGLKSCGSVLGKVTPITVADSSVTCSALEPRVWSFLFRAGKRRVFRAKPNLLTSRGGNE